MRITLAVLVLILCGTSYAQENQNADRDLDVYVQFSGVNIDNLTATGGPNTSLAKGFDLGSVWYPVRNIGLVGDFGYHHVSDSSSEFSVTTIMGGPRYWSGERYRLSCYGQFLLGSARLSHKGSFNAGTHWEGTSALGGGIEVRVTDRIVLRPIELDLMLVGLGNNAVGSGRIATGVVYRLR